MIRIEKILGTSATRVVDPRSVRHRPARIQREHHALPGAHDTFGEVPCFWSVLSPETCLMSLPETITLLFLAFSCLFFHSPRKEKPAVKIHRGLVLVSRLGGRDGDDYFFFFAADFLAGFFAAAFFAFAIVI